MRPSYRSQQPQQAQQQLEQDTLPRQQGGGQAEQDTLLRQQQGSQSQAQDTALLHEQGGKAKVEQATIPSSQHYDPDMSLLQAIKSDHNEIKQCYERYLEEGQAGGNPDAQTRWANQLTWAIARHSVGEELVVYPQLEKSLGEDGRIIAEGDRADHQYIKERLKLLQSMKSNSEPYKVTLKDVMLRLQAHMDSEEAEDLPKLERALTLQDSVAVAKSFERTKAFAPTRAHPSAPSKPPFETLEALLAAPIDKLKDAFSKFPSKEQRRDVAQQPVSDKDKKDARTRVDPAAAVAEVPVGRN